MRTQVPKTYDPGDMILLGAEFYNSSHALADPTSVALKVIDPEGVQTSYVPDKIGVGIYTHSYETDLTFTPGVYTYRFEGTGAVTTAEEKAFILNQSDFS